MSAAAAGALKSDRVAGLMLLALALYIGIANREYPMGSLLEPGPGYMPLLIAVFLGAMGILIALWGGDSPTLRAIGWPEARRAALILVVCAVGAFALERIGYRLTMVAILVFFLGVVERRRPLPVALVSLGFAFGSFFLFSTLLRVQLPRSPWGL